MSLSSYINEHDYIEYQEAIKLLEAGKLNEGLLSSLAGGIRKKIDFIKGVAETLKMDLSVALALFKESKVYKFFKEIKFSFGRLFALIKKGFKAYQKLQKVIAEYVANTKIGKWTKAELEKLDDFINKHPLLNKFSGLLVGGMLLFIWLNMAFTGDFAYDFDFTDMINAVQGNFALSELFAGTDGIKMLMLFATGLVGLSFPWAGPTSVQLIGGVIGSLYKMVKNKEIKLPGINGQRG